MKIKTQGEKSGNSVEKELAGTNLFPLLIFFFIPFIVSAQTFSRIYPNYINNRWGVVQCYDSGIAIASYSYPKTTGLPTLLKTDANGYILWASYLKDTSTTEVYTALGATSDGGFILGGLTDQQVGNPFIIKVNACRQIEWSHVFSNGFDISSILQLKDSGYIVDIYQYINNFGDLFCRLDNRGKPLWSILFMGQISNILAEDDGNFVITGSYDGVFTAKINPTGKVLWINIYKDKFGNQTYGGVTCQTHDKSYLTSFSLNNETVKILKRDSTGKEQSVTQLTDSPNDVASTVGMVFDSSDNSCILFNLFGPDTAKYNNFPGNVKLVKLDSNANVLKIKTYPYPDIEGNLVHAYANQFLFSGDTWLPDTTYALNLWKFNSNLEQDSFDDSDHFVYDYKCKTAITDTVSLAGADTIVIDTNNMTIVDDSIITVRTGIAQVNLLSNSRISVYPNPSNNTFNIELQGDNIQQSQVNLYDILGHSIASFSINKNEFTINASDYSMHSGVYILTIRSGNAVLNAKLVVE